MKLYVTLIYSKLLIVKAQEKYLEYFTDLLDCSCHFAHICFYLNLAGIFSMLFSASDIIKRNRQCDSPEILKTYSFIVYNYQHYINCIV